MVHALLIAVATAVAGQPPSADAKREHEVALWRRAFDRQAKEYRITAADQPARPFRLVEKPVFFWNQPVRFNQIGSVYIWLQQDGRPGVIGTIYCWNSWQQYWSISHEFHSLAPVPLRLVWKGETIWAPSQPGLKWKPLPRAGPPGNSRRRQLQQIRLLARRFHGHTIDKEGDRWQLRLLAKPLFDYAVKSNGRTAAGAVFAMCQGMDPELILAVEARSTPQGYRWHYACGAFTDLEPHLELDGSEVWTVAPTPTGGDPSKVYWRNRITTRARVPDDDDK